MMEYKAAEFKLGDMTDEGVFEGYASVFGAVDQGLDVVERGAFMDSIGRRRVKMLWQHDQRQPIGVWDEVREDERGLYVKGRLVLEIEKAREALALLKAGAIDGLSIGYKTVEAVRGAAGQIRKLLKVDLFEVSLVTFPMLPEAQVTDVKSIRTEREFENFLRDAGFSRREAKAITARGFRATQRDACDESAAIKDVVARINRLKETIHAE